MAWCVFSLLVGATLLFQSTTYLLWRYEVRVHGAPAPAGPRLPHVTALVADWGALLFVLVASALGMLGRERPVRTGAARPVVLLHGAGARRGAMALLAARLRRDGRAAYPISYPAGSPDLDAQGASVAASVRELAARTEAGRVDVVAHGQGGVVIRAAARHHGCLPLLGNVVTLGAPHQGSTLAAFWGSKRSTRLRPHSRFLDGLSSEDPLPAHCNVTSIYSTYDAIVFPCELSYYAGALNVRIDWVGHHSLLVSDRVYRLAKENLDVEPKLAATA
jgi:triacylglycerol esterase/lipase EstA (alpha/beta hydrolase family)